MRTNMYPQPLARFQWYLMTYVFACAGHAATLFNPSMRFCEIMCMAKIFNLRPQPRSMLRYRAQTLTFSHTRVVLQ